MYICMYQATILAGHSAVFARITGALAVSGLAVAAISFWRHVLER